MSENILIAYFSWSGNTRKAANKIQEYTGGTLYEISPQVPYPADYNQVLNQAKKEINCGYRPALKSPISNINSYDRIFVGSPNWWNTIAPPVSTFLTEHDFTGRVIIPFCTHGGGGQGNITHAITNLCPHALISDCKEIYGRGSDLNNDTLSKLVNSKAKYC